MRSISRAAGLAAIVLLCSTVAAQAQSGLTLGARGGVVVSKLSGTDTFDAANRNAFTGGVFANFDMSLLGIQVGAQYTQKGADLDVSEAVEELSLNYLEIPAVLKLGVPLGIIKPSVFGGVGLGFNTGCTDPDGADCKDNVKSTDFSGIAGADVAVYVGPITLFVDGRYHFGLSKINATAVVGDLKNRHWAFQGGIGFRL